MKYEFNFGNGVICLPESVLLRMETASESDLKLLLLLASGPAMREEPDSAKLGVALGISAAEVEISLAFWRGAGILKGSKSPKKNTTKQSACTSSSEPVQVVLPAPEVVTDTRDLPTYSGSEIEKILAEKKGLQSLLNECQNALGKVFSVHESGKIIGLADYLGLEDGYLLLLCSYLKSIGKASVAYLTKTATELYHNNVDNLGALEAYIEQRERIASFEGKMRKLMGIGARALSTKEREIFGRWSEFGYSDEIFALAYDRTVEASGKASVNLMNTILQEWKDKGVSDLPSAEACIREHKNEMKKKYSKKSEPAQAFAESSFDTDEFFDIALKKSLELAQKKQDGETK